MIFHGDGQITNHASPIEIGSVLAYGQFTSLTPGNFGTVHVYGTATIRGSYDQLHLHNDGTFSMYNNTFGDLILAPGHSYTFHPSSPQTIINSLVADGTCDERIRLVNANLQKTDGTVEVYHLEMTGCQASGGATFQAYEVLDHGGNTGWDLQAALPKTLYWVGGSGDWHDAAHWSLTTGGVSSGCIPSVLDSVVLNANSFTIPNESLSITATAECRSITLTADVPEHSWIGNGELIIKGSMMLSGSVDFQYTGTLLFSSTGPGNTLSSGGAMINSNITFNGVGGEWALQDDFWTSGMIDLIKGSFFTNDHQVNAETFRSIGSSPRSLSLGSSVIELSGSGMFQNSPWNMIGASLQVEPGMCTIRFMGSGLVQLYHSPAAVFHSVEYMDPDAEGRVSGSHTIDQITFHGNGNLGTAATFNEVYLSPGKTYSGSIVLLGTLYASGNCGAPIHLSGFNVQSNAPVSISYAFLTNCSMANGILSTASNSLDLGGNVGWSITVSSPSSLYWIGGDGDWWDPTHWSFTSGGASSGCVPWISDDVIFDTNSFTAEGEVVTMSASAYCRNMTWDGTPGAVWAGIADLKLDGSLLLYPGMDIQYTGAIELTSTDLGNVLATGGNTLGSNITFNGDGSDWILQDPIIMVGALGDIRLFKGALDLNGQDITARSFHSTGTSQRSLLLGNSAITLTGNADAWTIQGEGISFSGGNSHLIFTASGTVVLTGGNQVYHNVDFTNPAGRGRIAGQNQFNDMVFHGDSDHLGGNTIYHDLTFSPGSSNTRQGVATLVVNGNFHANGDCGHPIKILRLGFSKEDGEIEVDHVHLHFSNTLGNAAFITTNAVDLGGNEGWAMELAEPRTHYWIAGGGHWDEPGHWSDTSGGASNGCLPNQYDDVIFDEASGLTPLDSVRMVPGAACHNMTWLPGTGGAIWFGSQPFDIFGSLTLSPDMIIGFTGNITFSSTNSGNTITTAGRVIRSRIEFRGSGSWTLLDSLVTNDMWPINLYEGTLNTNGHFLYGRNFRAFSSLSPTLNLGNSTVMLRNSFSVGEDVTFDAGTSTIHLFSSTSSSVIGGGHTYHDVIFSHPNAEGTIYHDNAFHEVRFVGDGQIQTNSSNTFGTLHFSPGKRYRIGSNTTQTILEDLVAIGTPDSLIEIRGPSTLHRPYFHKSSGMICIDHCTLRMTRTSGGATFYAGNSQDLNDNTGWIFAPCLPAPSMTYSSTTTCAGGTIQFTNTSEGPVIGQEWSFPGGEPATSNDPAPVVNYASEGSYPVQLVVYFQNSTDTVYMADLVQVIPADEVWIINDGYMLSANIVGSAYQWFDCMTEMPIPGATGEVFIPEASGTYGLHLSLEDCVITADCVPVIATSIGTALSGTSRLYPNPNTGSFILETLEAQLPFEIVILDVTGRILHQQQITGSITTIEMEAKPGVYHLFQRPSGTGVPQRFIIQ